MTFQAAEMSAPRFWSIVVGLSFGTAATVGMSRFGYGLILPAMKADLNWNYTYAGWIHTANAVGYLTGALLALHATKRFQLHHLFMFGLLLTSIAVIATGLTHSFEILNIARLLTGIGNALAFISGGAIVASLAPDRPQVNALSVGVYFSGVGLGLAGAGAFIPLVLSASGVSGWPLTWLIMGTICALITVPASLSAHIVMRGEAQKQENASTISKPLTAERAQNQQALPLPYLCMLPYFVGYFLYGFGANIFITFVVSWIQNGGGSFSQIVTTWLLMGAGMALSAFFWSRVLARFKNGIPLALSCGLTAATIGLPLLNSETWVVSTSAFLFGLAFMAGPPAVTTFVKKNLPKTAWGPGVAFLTMGFALGQPIGPLAAGWLADLTSQLSHGLILGAGALAFGSLSSICQRAFNRSRL